MVARAVLDGLLAWGMGIRLHWTWLAISFWSVTAIIIGVTQPVLLSNDGPQQIFAAIERARIAAGASSAFIENSAITSRGAVDLVEFALVFVAWERAWMVTLLVAALLWAWGLWFLVRGLAPRTPIALIGCATALSWPWFMGLVPFVLASGMSWIVLGVGLTKNGRSIDANVSVGRAVVVAMMLWVCSRLHVMPAAIVGATLAVAWLSAAPRLRTCGLVGLVGLPAASVALLATEFASAQQGTVAASAPLPLDELAMSLFGGPPLRAAILFGLTAVAGLLAVWRGQRVPRILAGMALLLLVISAFTPRDVAGWQFASSRALPSALALAWTALAPQYAHWQKWAKAATTIVVVLWVASAGIFAWQSLNTVWAQTEVANTIRALPATPGIHRLTVVTARPGAIAHEPRVAPLLHLGQLVAIVHGGSDHFGQDRLPSVHTILRRDGFCPEPFPLHSDMADVMALTGAERHEALLSLLRVAWAHDDVVVLGAAGDESAYTAAGFDIVGSVGDLTALKARRCQLQLRSVTEAGELSVLRGDEVLMRVPALEAGAQAEIERLPCDGLSVTAAAGRCTTTTSAAAVVVDCVGASQ